MCVYIYISLSISIVMGNRSSNATCPTQAFFGGGEQCGKPCDGIVANDSMHYL